MPNRNLTDDELAQAHALLTDIRQRLNELSAGDPAVLFAFRRKIAKELTYDERGKPADRNKLKARKFGEQHGLCTECREPLPEKFAELDRKNAIEGYTPENTELIHAACHRKRQAAPRVASDELEKRLVLRRSGCNDPVAGLGPATHVFKAGRPNGRSLGGEAHFPRSRPMLDVHLTLLCRENVYMLLCIDEAL